jgi:cytochrome c-type biogenesis protein
MINELFTRLSMVFYEPSGWIWGAALLWGVLSVLLSPCHLSSIPLIVGIITAQQDEHQRKPLLMSTLFSLGIMISIIIIGIITAALGRIIGDIGTIGTVIFAALFVAIGLYLMDILPLNWNLVNLNKNGLRGKSAAFVAGLLFGIGVGPCTFAFMAPILGVVFSTAAQAPLHAILLMLLYTIGHCGIIVVAGTAVSNVQRYLNWTDESRLPIYLKRFCGALVALGGIYLIIKTL